MIDPKLINSVNDEYAVAIGVAYTRLLSDLAAFLLDRHLTPDFRVSDKGAVNIVPYDDISAKVLKEVSQFTGRCGGYCGAASKRAKTDLVVAGLETLDDCDLTSTMANNLCKAILGRGMNRDARALFSTPGRTAADKSTLLEKPTPKIELFVNDMRLIIAGFDEFALKTRLDCGKQWVENWFKVKYSRAAGYNRKKSNRNGTTAGNKTESGIKHISG